MHQSGRINLVLLLLVASSSTAAPTGKGLSGEFSIMAGVVSSSSNFDTDDPIKSGGLDSEGGTEQNYLVLPLGQLRYNFGSHIQHEVFLGTSRADIIQGVAALEIGYKHWLGKRSFLSFSVLPTIMESETWADPFLINESRDVTDESGNAYRFQFQDIAGSGLNADVGYYKKTIDNELSGRESNYSGSVAQQVAKAR